MFKKPYIPYILHLQIDGDPDPVPNPAYLCDADPDADPDPDFDLMRMRIQVTKITRILIRITAKRYVSNMLFCFRGGENSGSFCVHTEETG